MKFKIIHETEYEFSEAVFLEPHSMIFRPKNQPHLDLESHLLKLSITPAGISEQLDAEDNFLHFCWFEGMHKKISITSEAVLNSSPHNPFNFLVYPIYFNTIPFSYSDASQVLLHRYLRAETIQEDLVRYGKTILASKNNDTLSFLTELTIAIHTDFIVESREEGSPFEADKTFRLKKGSCRDLVWMQIQLLRNLGIASRFVSGYYYVNVEDPQYELHAWTEVFIPGAGWIGFDPSNGITTSHTHIAVASSSHYENTMPVSGSVRGDATSKLRTTLVIEVVDA
ncbi:transglutaminase family protein [Flagellimonas hymeniacidonis]|uniref:Transglutaminase family protein n=1 Tax=Flagellimonas hymeniacidonis TaxID=2603628 RepID=A0A5C8V9G3_9FLAO|nr:transglutaminase family protein [Flagellimonas hymeniacidonis]TXN37840.1 transglutaminase family protein [Flagellimonas hymeniacidonis]